jgi:DNA-binding NarL/FixJ family response regulator
MMVKLLIADDTDHVRRMLVDILSLHGFDIVGEAATGDEAVTKALQQDPDVIVMDLKMPETDGIEAARRIKGERPDMQVILYSAFVDSDVEERAHRAGVSVCIPKLSGVEALAREVSALAMDLGASGG